MASQKFIAALNVHKDHIIDAYKRNDTASIDRAVNQTAFSFQCAKDNGLDILPHILAMEHPIEADQNRCVHTTLLDCFKDAVSKGEFIKQLHTMDNLGRSLVHMAVAADCTVLLQYLATMGCNLDAMDSNGNTPLLEAAKEGKCNLLKFFVDQKCNIKAKNSWGETPFLMACRNLRFEAATFLADKDAGVKSAKDDNGNTALHQICHATLGSDQQNKSFLDLLIWLTDLERYYKKKEHPETLTQMLQETNSSNHTFLMILADNENLSFFLNLGDNEYFEMLLPQLFANSTDGLNVLHIHAGKFNLEKLHEDFKKSKFSKLWKKLITSRVRSGQYRGYGCLHFACQAGNLDNINYLLTKHPRTMKLKDNVLHGCPSPKDLLTKHKHDGLLSKLQSVSFQQLIESVDNVQKALSLPSVEDAKLTLEPLCDKDLKSIVKNPHRHRNDQCLTSVVRLLHMAMKEDSTEIFRCIVALGFWPNLSTQDAAEEFNKFICKKIKKGNAVSEGIISVLPSLHKGFDNYLKWNLKSKHTRQICFDLPSASLLGIAIRSGRINIAKDLILLEQFNLVPTCLLVVEECQSLIDETNALRECMEDLSSFALNVALNAMDALDKSADEKQRRLLHRYMGGRFHPEIDYEHRCGPMDSINCGPKFASFGIHQVHRGADEKHENTILELAVQSKKSKQIVASSCFSKLAEFEWEIRCIKSTFRASPRVKFRLHMAAHIAFLMLLTYFVCFLEPGTPWIDMLMFVFGISMWIQELVDIGQIAATKSLRYDRFQNTRLNAKTYLLNFWNWMDMFGIATLLVGLSWKCNVYIAGARSSVDESFYIIRMVLATSHLIWSFRFISFMKAFKLMGLFISMLKTLLRQDLPSFLIIFLTMCISFGVFFFNLLHPDIRSYFPNGSVGERNLQHLFSIYTRPLMAVFGELGWDDLSKCGNASTGWPGLANESGQDMNKSNVPSDASCTHPIGTFHYQKYLILPFLFLINLILINMLIAKFSLTVSSKQDVAYMIWRNYDAHLLVDYTRSPTLPPPFTVIWLIVAAICKWCCKLQQAKRNSVNDVNWSMQRWWAPDKLEILFGSKPPKKPETAIVVLKSGVATSAKSRGLPNDATAETEDFRESFKEYIKFQARTFMDRRAEFTKPRNDHGSMIEKVKVDIQKLDDKLEAVSAVLSRERGSMIDKVKLDIQKLDDKLELILSKMANRP